MWLLCSSQRIILSSFWAFNLQVVVVVMCVWGSVWCIIRLDLSFTPI